MLKKRTLVLATTLAGLAMVLAGWIAFSDSAMASHGDKVTICHASGLAGTTKYETLTIGWMAVYDPAGHFYENGTPRAGHEQDYLGACKTPTPASTATDVPIATLTPYPTYIPLPTYTPYPTATEEHERKHTRTPRPTLTPYPTATPRATAILWVPPAVTVPLKVVAPTTGDGGYLRE